MDWQVAFVLLRGTIYDLYIIPLLIAVAAVPVAASYWRIPIQWLRGFRGRNWTTVPAIIDVVSVVPQTTKGRYGEETIGYLGTLTYFYRNAELQTGDFNRMFHDEAEAQAWTASYKGNSVMVHVDPRDPSRSVLRKEEL